MPERASAKDPGVADRPANPDAVAAREALRQPVIPPAPRRGRGRPTRPAPPAPGPGELAGGEDPQFWGGQLQTLWNSFAKQRGYAPIPDEAVSKIGMSAALVAQKWGPQQTKYPELLLLVMMAPYIASAVTVELRRIREADKSKRGKQPTTDGTAPLPTTRPLDPSELETKPLDSSELQTRPL